MTAAALIEEKGGDLANKKGASKRYRIVADRNIEHHD